MTKIMLAAAPVAALFMLGGCGGGATNNAAANETAEANKAGPRELPPAIKSAASYRCKDNSVVHVTLMTDNVTAMVRDKQENPPLATLKAPTAGQPYEGEGYKLTVDGDNIVYDSPDGAALTCRS